MGSASVRSVTSTRVTPKRSRNAARVGTRPAKREGTRAPSGLNTADVTDLPCANGGLSFCPVRASHTCTVQSQLAVTVIGVFVELAAQADVSEVSEFDHASIMPVAVSVLDGG